MFEDAIDLPSAADIMANDRVKHVAAVSSSRRTFPDNLFDLINTILASVAVEAIAVDRCGLFCSSFAAFAPYNRPIKHLVDIGELLDRVEPIAGDRQSFAGAPKQLSCDRLVIRVCTRIIY